MTEERSKRREIFPLVFIVNNNNNNNLYSAHFRIHGALQSINNGLCVLHMSYN